MKCFMANDVEQPDEMRRVTTAVMEVASKFGFSESRVFPPTSESMTAWAYYAETEEFRLDVERDRGGYVGINVGSKVRRKPRAHMRGPWSLSHLRGFLEGHSDHFVFADIEEKIRWLEDNLESLLDTSFLNSDELNKWAIKASRRMFG